MVVVIKQSGHEIFKHKGQFYIILKDDVKDFLKLGKAVVWALFNPK